MLFATGNVVLICKNGNLVVNVLQPKFFQKITFLSDWPLLEGGVGIPSICILEENAVDEKYLRIA